MAVSERTHRSQWKQWLAAWAAILPIIAVGYLGEMVVQDYDVDIRVNESAVLLIITGCVIGAIFGGVSADIFGRKRTLLAITVGVIGGVIQMHLQDFEKIRYVFTLTGGITAGIACTVVPLYISEIADDDIRGRLLMLQLFGIYIGEFIIVPWGLSILDFYFIIIPILFLITIFWFPESPYYLASKKQYEAATKSLIFFRGIDQETAKEEVQVIIDSVKEDGSSKGMCQKFVDLFKRKNWKGLIIVAILIILQWDRPFVDPSFDPAADCDFSHTHKSVAIIYHILTASRFILVGVLILTIDTVGRRLYLLGSTLVGLFIVSLVQLVAMDQCYVFFMVHYILHWCHVVMFGVPLVLVVELFPTNVRSIASSMAVIFGTIFKRVFVWINWKTLNETNDDMYILIPLYLFSFLFILAFVPETKQRTFSDIQNALADTRLKCRRDIRHRNQIKE